VNVVITIISVLHILIALFLIAVVLLQSGKTAGLSGSIAGGAESFFGKSKGKTIDAVLSKWTSVVAVLFIVTSVALTLLK